ncbi:MAG: LacI family DNA-binding transcriptional regulator [Actinomycetaceae bacterium]|nr:LacI family DNA-binding transcriptional regulator [Actinomycetaceae bacterium]MDU0971064.1 LacI family DNA-binding transcriptional regulator [Actinomycetaceae bacterium]
MPPTIKRATSADVARAAGVSRATVSYVLNNTPGQSISDATRERVKEAADSLGYIPNGSALALQQGSSDIVLMAMPNFPHSTTLSHTQEAVATFMSQANKALAVWLQGTVTLRDMLRNVHPCIVIAPAGLTDSDRDLLARAGIPLVDPNDAADPAPAGGDGVRIGRAQIDYLAGRGARAIAATTPIEDALTFFATPRLEGIRAALATHSLPEPEVLRLPTPSTIEHDPALVQTLQQAIDAGCDAVACYNDIHAAQLLAAATTLGIDVPGDLMIMGVDNEPLGAYTTPPLTTLAQGHERYSYDLVVDALTRIGQPTDTLTCPDEDYVTVRVRESA